MAWIIELGAGVLSLLPVIFCFLVGLAVLYGIATILCLIGSFLGLWEIK